MVTILQIDRVRCGRRGDKSSRCGHEKPGENNAGTLSAAIRRWIKFSTSSNPKGFSKFSRFTVKHRKLTLREQLKKDWPFAPLAPWRQVLLKRVGLWFLT